MTTAQRPTWVTAKGAASARDLGVSTHMSARDLPAHTKLKERQFGQGRGEELTQEELKAKLLEREREHQQKRKREGREIGVRVRMLQQLFYHGASCVYSFTHERKLIEYIQLQITRKTRRRRRKQ